MSMPNSFLFQRSPLLFINSVGCVGPGSSFSETGGRSIFEGIAVARSKGITLEFNGHVQPSGTFFDRELWCVALLCSLFSPGGGGAGVVKRRIHWIRVGDFWPVPLRRCIQKHA